DPIAADFVEVFADVGLALRVLAVDVGAKGIEVIGRGNDVLRIIPQHVGEGSERLRRGERPDRAVPFAMADAVRAELRMASLGSGEAKRRAEALRVGEL